MTTVTKHEDAVMKMGFDYFRDTILKTLNIHYEFVDSKPTEAIEIHIDNLYMDYNFLTTEDVIVHIEFQTTEDHVTDDLMRFHVYEALLMRKEKKKVITYVIYSGGIEKVRTELECGIHTYRVNPIYLTGHDADEIFQSVKAKIEAGEPLSEDDFANLTLTPLMTSKMCRKDVIKEAIQIVKQEKQLTAEKTMAMLYTLADKFLSAGELNEIKEVLAMTRLGQMLYDDGVKKGMERGMEKKDNQLTELTARLLEENRLDDLKRSTEDKEFKEQLLKEFGIE
ncbi:MAG: hypothetical protein SOX45_04520 [Lachnospiraceae bacterium]|nr:hypothetical protein [Lachnospiraceae bacterium]